MKVNIEMNLKFKGELNLKNLTTDDLQSMGYNEKTLKDYFKEEMIKDVDKFLAVTDDEQIKANYKITKFSVTLEED